MSLVTMTAKQLKNRTGDAFRAISRGDRVLLTLRGKSVAVITPIRDQGVEVRPFEEAWVDIEEALRASAPHYPTLAAAMDASRRRA